MTAFRFAALDPPFPRWMGPFSPARGNRSDFRIKGGALGVWVDEDDGSSFWEVEPSRGVAQLVDVVQSSEWRGGRVLLLPTGHVVKPGQRDEEVGIRFLLGHFEGPVRLRKPDGSRFDLAAPGESPGSAWHGPKSTGLECILTGEGRLDCIWYHPSAEGRISSRQSLSTGEHALFNAFRKVRPGVGGGRVRLTANGQVITNVETSHGWQARYLGWIDPRRLGNWDSWAE